MHSTYNIVLLNILCIKSEIKNQECFYKFPGKPHALYTQRSENFVFNPFSYKEVSKKKISETFGHGPFNGRWFSREPTTRHVPFTCRLADTIRWRTE